MDDVPILRPCTQTRHFRLRRRMRGITKAAVDAVVRAPFRRRTAGRRCELLTAPVLTRGQRRWLTVVMADGRRLVTCFLHRRPPIAGASS